jgi:AcrR family transcriptional regulator
VAREGTRRATTNRIAETAGVSIGSLYQYFPNKGVLVDAVRAREAEHFDAALPVRFEALATGSLRGAVRGLVDLLIARHRERLALHNALAADDGGFHDALEKRWLPVAVQHLDARRAELRPANLALAARIAFDVVEAMTHGVALRSPELLDDPEYAAELTELVARYLAR